MANQGKHADGARESRRKPRVASRDRRTQAPAGSQAEPLRLEQAFEGPAAAGAADILALQSGHGNQAVSGLIQTKLRVGASGDAYEQEADRVAERALSQPAPHAAVQRQGDLEDEELQAKPLADSITPLVQRQLEDEEEEIQTKPAVETAVAAVQREFGDEEEELIQGAPEAGRGKDGFEAGGAIEQRLASLRGTGSPLPADVQADMERRFGTGFGAVRVHDDDEADRLNQSLRSKAFTHRSDVYFSSGRYDPASSSGRQLLAHELTHVVQQTGGGSSGAASAGGQGAPAVQRQGKEEEEEEQRRRRQGAQPLMLTDKPWSEIEKERSPVRKLLRGTQQTPPVGSPTLQAPSQQSSPPLALTDRPWSEIEEERRQKSSQPLALTDKPWSEIEKERSPVRNLLRGESQAPPGIPSMQLPTQVQMPAPQQQTPAPLALTDKPWSEIEKERSGEQKPPEEQQKPPEEQQKPPEEQQKPPEGEQKPPEGEQKPPEGEQKPPEEQQKPPEEQQKPPEEQQKPAPKGRRRRARPRGRGKKGARQPRVVVKGRRVHRRERPPSALETWKAGWGAFFKETIPAKLASLTPTSTRRAQQRALANRRRGRGRRGLQLPTGRPRRTNIGTIEQYLKERKAAKEEEAKKKAEQEKAKESTQAPAQTTGGASGLETGIKIGELQAEIRGLRARIDELEKRG